MAKKIYRFRVGRTTEDGVFHILPFDEVSLSSTTACGLRGAWIDGHISENEKEVDCGNCLNSTIFKEKN